MIVSALLPSRVDAQEARARVRAILVDGQLNQKPIPRLAVTITRLDPSDSAPLTIKTDFDGSAEVALAPGKYRFETGSPITRAAW